ncbi:silent information regulator protein Sir2 [Catellatospora sp. TT07R-123]|uniref:family 16 glycoside hydrolase n=1 Tax=Catellatospora sp. TT07R-123 TaxID=2733863 RepID=UPI001B0BBA2E|nr:family 16 glycoside hydrolase [Catellatospora sp. TT07R-123]GHJ43638.1 silent information regulator protein Sir2 [Catellatospora sp. TT07R-123]
MHQKTRHKGLLAAATGALTAAAAVVLALSSPAAAAAPLFGDDFNDGNATGWTTSGGTWSVATDGTPAYQQAGTSSDARARAGSTGWTDYTVTARVKPTAVNGSNRFVALLARVQSATSYYYVALRSNNTVELKKLVGGSSTTLATGSATFTTGTWYTLSLEVSGSTLRASVNGATPLTATDTQFASGQVGVATYYAGARFDDVAVTDGAAPSPSASASPSRSASPSPSASASPSPSTSPSSGTVYVSPTGRDSAAGTQADPTTLPSAITRVAAGGTIYLRGGTYNLSQTVTIAPGNNGTSGARKKLSAYPGETPVLNFSAMPEDPANRGLAVNGSYWHVFGVVVERAGDNGIFVGGSHNIIERTVTRYNHDTGLQLSRIASDTPRAQWPADNLILSAESHDNADSDGEDADGFAAKLTVGAGNIFRYAVSHNNIDDGWDLYTKPDTGAIDPVTIEDSLSYDNGTLSNGGQAGAGDRNGYKLGGEDIGVNHIVRRSIAYHNGKHGFTYNSNPGSMTITSNVSIDNAERNFNFDAGTSVFRSDTSCRSGSGTNDRIIGDADSSNQFWSGANGSRCSSYTGALGWSFAADGHLVVTFGGRVVTP